MPITTTMSWGRPAGAGRTDHARRWWRRRGERGVSLVEYALLVALLAVPSIAGIQALQDGMGDASQGAADRISDPTIPIVPSTTTQPPPPTTNSTTSTTSTTTTTTTTTTTIPPATTTTQPPTTTIPPPSQSVSTFGQVTTSTASNPTRWSAQTSVAIRNNANAPVPGATVVVGIEFRKGGTWSSGPNLTATTNATGTLLIDSGLYPSSGGSRADEIRFRVISVTAPGLTWQPNAQAPSALKPN